MHYALAFYVMAVVALVGWVLALLAFRGWDVCNELLTKALDLLDEVEPDLSDEVVATP